MLFCMMQTSKSTMTGNLFFRLRENWPKNIELQVVVDRDNLDHHYVRDMTKINKF